MRSLFLSLWLLTIAGCASLPQTPENMDEAILSSHQQQIARLLSWKLRGKVAVSDEDEKWSASLRWKQNKSDYIINLVGPLGQGSAKISGNDTTITLETSDGETLHSNQPQTLLEEQLGWKLPMKALRYWVIGIPHPGDARQSLNSQGQSTYIEQSGWDISYENYTLYDKVSLPARITIHQGVSSVRLIIYQWELIADNE
jgi:outer membrane lipoprotein LolB